MFSDLNRSPAFWTTFKPPFFSHGQKNGLFFPTTPPVGRMEPSNQGVVVFLSYGNLVFLKILMVVI